MMTVIVGHVVGVSLATQGANIWISASEFGRLVAAMLDGRSLDAARATSPDGAWLIVPQDARVDRALRDLRWLLDALVHDVRGNEEASTPALPRMSGEGAEVAAIAERIREAWRGGASRRRLALVAGYPQYGGSYVRKIEEAIEWLEAEARHGDAATTGAATTGGNGRGSGELVGWSGSE